MKRSAEKKEVAQIVDECLDRQEKSYNAFGVELGLGRNAVRNRLGQTGISVNNALEMLNALGYDLVAVPKSGLGEEIVIKCSGGDVK